MNGRREQTETDRLNREGEGRGGAALLGSQRTIKSSRVLWLYLQWPGEYAGIMHAYSKTKSQMKLNECRRQNKRASSIKPSATKTYAIKVAIKLILNFNYNCYVYDIIS